MGRVLIIAEKPAQAREYAAALGVGDKGQGCLVNEKYVITWCVGHLLELERPEVYMDLEKVGKRWSLQRLPVLPEINAFRRAVKPGTSQQFLVLKKWLQDAEIDHVVCGTDADREGQLLFQEIWDLEQCTKPLSRLWISSLTTEAIREGMNQLLPGQAVAGLAAAGYGRAFADWDFGMNLTEGFTSLFGSFDPVRKKPNVISIGRVQTPTLALIVEREWEIERFVPESYFDLKATFAARQGEYIGTWYYPNQDDNLQDKRADHSEADRNRLEEQKRDTPSEFGQDILPVSIQDNQKAAIKNTKQEAKNESRQEDKRLTDRRKAEAIAAKIKGKQGEAIKVEQKKVSEPPPLLFDLTSLTVTASKRFGFSAEKVLELAQTLYEKKAITYPRTDCAYLPEDMLPKLPAHLAAVCQEPYTKLAEEAKSQGVPQGKRVINTITAHHAIIPTTEKMRLEKLPELERKLYDLIVRRFLAVWYPAAWYLQTEIITEVEQELFRTKGKVMLSPGWKQVEDIRQDAEEPKKKTRKERSEEENAELPPVNQGESVLTKRVNIEEKSTKPPKRFTQGDLLKAMESAGKQIEDEILRQQMKGKGLGTVATRPAILENLIQRGYIRQEQKTLRPTEKGTELIALIKKRLPQAQLLISAEMTGQLEYDLAKVEKGELSLEEYMTEVKEAIIRIIQELRAYERKYGKTPLSLAPSKVTKKVGNPKGEAGDVLGESIGVTVGKADTPKGKALTEKIYHNLGACPRCGGEIIEGQKGYGCSEWKKGCSFVVWKKPICGKVLTQTQIKSLLKKGKTSLIKGFKSKNGQTFAAHLVWEDAKAGKLKFEFATEA